MKNITKNITKVIKTSFLVLALAKPTAACAMSMSIRTGGQSDVYSSMNYDNVFDPERFKGFEQLMKAWGCYDNVFKKIVDDPSTESIRYREKEESAAGPSDSASNPRTVRDYQPIAREDVESDTTERLTSPFNEEAEEMRFRAMCLERLKSARNKALLSPVTGPSCVLCAIEACALGSWLCQGKDTVAGGQALNSGLFSGAGFLAQVTDTLRTYFWARPINPLESLETKYALEQCFIPRKLWPRIKEMFRQLRGNPMESAIATLDRILDFQSLKPRREILMRDICASGDAPEFKPAHEVLSNPRAARILRNNIEDLVRSFFSHYEPMDDAEYHYLITAIYNFIYKVVLNNAEPTPLFLVGTWGVGKTHFFKVLQTWIEQLLPESICAHQITIESPSELRGGKDEPGLFLDIIRRQLRDIKKHGTIACLDEAMWLNAPNMTESAKQTFSDEHFKTITTKFFNTGEDIAFDMVPTLFLVASNDKIVNGATNNRFRTINFPLPKKETLIAVTLANLKKDAQGMIISELSTARQTEIFETITKDILACPTERQNFRDAKTTAETVADTFFSKYREDAASSSAAGVFPDEIKKSQ